MGVYKSRYSGPQIDGAVDDIQNLDTKVNTLILENNFEQLDTTDKTVVGAINEVNGKIDDIEDSAEEWIFTLENGTTITKEVVVIK